MPMSAQAGRSSRTARRGTAHSLKVMCPARRPDRLGTTCGAWSPTAAPPSDPLPWKVSYEVPVARWLPGALMDASLLAVLNDTERSLVAETEPAKLAAPKVSNVAKPKSQRSKPKRAQPYDENGIIEPDFGK